MLSSTHRSSKSCSRHRRHRTRRRRTGSKDICGPTGERVGVAVLATRPMDDGKSVFGKCFQPPSFAASRFRKRFELFEGLMVGADGERHTQQVMAEMLGNKYNSEQLLLSYAVVVLGLGEELAAVGNDAIPILLALDKDSTHTTGLGVGVEDKRFGGRAEICVTEDRSGGQTVFEAAEGSLTCGRPMELRPFCCESMRWRSNVGKAGNEPAVISGEAQETANIGGVLWLGPICNSGGLRR